VFFDAVRLLLDAGVTVVAEAAFQHETWLAKLQPLTDLAHMRVVQCHADPATARSRVTERGIRRAHADAQFMKLPEDFYDTFERLSIDAPSIDVDTTAGYTPALAEVVAFVNRP
jgi:predicted kinase